MNLREFQNKYRGNNYFNEVINYLKSEGYESKDIRFNFIKAKEKYFEYITNKEKKDPGLIKKIHIFDNGFYVAKLTDQKAIRYEGRAMSNCLADINKKMNVYSIRDNYNKSHISFEIEKKEIIQSLGKGNSPVSKKYRIYLMEFAQRFNLTLGSDSLKSIGLSRISPTSKDMYLNIFDNIKFMTIGSQIYIDNDLNCSLKNKINNISGLQKYEYPAITSLIVHIIKFEKRENKILHLLLEILRETNLGSNDLLMVIILNELIKNKKGSIVMPFYERISNENKPAWFSDNAWAILQLDPLIVIKMIKKLKKSFHFEEFISEISGSTLVMKDKKRILRTIIEIDGVVIDVVSMIGYCSLVKDFKENRSFMLMAIKHYSKNTAINALWESTRYLSTQDFIEFIIILRLIKGDFEKDLVMNKSMNDKQIIALNYLKSHIKINRSVLEALLDKTSERFPKFRNVKQS